MTSSKSSSWSTSWWQVRPPRPFAAIHTAFSNPLFPTDNVPCHFTAAFAAGFCTTIMASPVDVVKTRFMNSAPGQYSGAMNCAVTMLMKEGPTAFYKGWLWSIQCGAVSAAHVCWLLWFCLQLHAFVSAPGILEHCDVCELWADQASCGKTSAVLGVSDLMEIRLLLVWTCSSSGTKPVILSSYFEEKLINFLFILFFTGGIVTPSWLLGQQTCFYVWCRSYQSGISHECLHKQDTDAGDKHRHELEMN